MEPPGGAPSSRASAEDAPADAALGPADEAAVERLREIGFELGLSSKTVDVHRAKIMERLQLTDVASLTRYAVRKGLVKD